MKKILLSIFVSLIFISEVFAVPNYKQEIDISDDTEGLRGINFKPDGTIMYISRRINIGSLEGDASRVVFINQYINYFFDTFFLIIRISYAFNIF